MYGALGADNAAAEAAAGVRRQRGLVALFLVGCAGAAAVVGGAFEAAGRPAAVVETAAVGPGKPCFADDGCTEVSQFTAYDHSRVAGGPVGVRVFDGDKRWEKGLAALDWGSDNYYLDAKGKHHIKMFYLR